MEYRTTVSQRNVKESDTKQLRDDFLITNLFIPNKIEMVYSQFDRIITGGAVPVTQELIIHDGNELKSNYFLERREMGIINIGGCGEAIVDGHTYKLANRDGLYIGKGNKKVVLRSDDASNPAKFYFNSTPAHHKYPTVLIKQEGIPEKDTVIIPDKNKAELGSLEKSNHRMICKYILPGQVESCQLVMGMTSLKPGSVWNTMPCHTHDRRMEVYLYFDIPDDAFVVHYCGEPQETRHIIVRNEEAVISPSWSIHAGSGSQSYTFIWGMAGENQEFTDMDDVDNSFLK